MPVEKFTDVNRITCSKIHERWNCTVDFNLPHLGLTRREFKTKPSIEGKNLRSLDIQKDRMLIGGENMTCTIIKEKSTVKIKCKGKSKSK